MHATNKMNPYAQMGEVVERRVVINGCIGIDDSSQANDSIDPIMAIAITAVPTPIRADELTNALG